MSYSSVTYRCDGASVSAGDVDPLQPAGDHQVPQAGLWLLKGEPDPPPGRPNQGGVIAARTGTATVVRNASGDATDLVTV